MLNTTCQKAGAEYCMPKKKHAKNQMPIKEINMIDQVYQHAEKS